MLEEQLSKYSFFSKVGAYSIKLDNPKSVLSSMKYTLDVIEKECDPAPLVCMFPQGKMFPPSKRPLNVKSGFEWILKHTTRDLSVLPLGMRIEYLDQQLPQVFLQFGEVLYPKGGSELKNFERNLSTLLDDMLDQISNGITGNMLLLGKKSVSEQWDSFKTKITQTK
jgi:chlorobactene lauroyltransferase